MLNPCYCYTCDPEGVDLYITLLQLSVIIAFSWLKPYKPDLGESSTNGATAGG